MRVAILVPTLQPSGGVQTAIQHVRFLQDQDDVDVALVVTDAGVPEPDALPGVEILSGGAAAERDWDVAVATWWTTWGDAAELRARRLVLFLQGLDARFYRRGEPLDRLAASMPLAGADAVVAVSRYLEDVVAAIRPDVRCDVVPNGLDRDVFAHVEPRRGQDGDPLRILIEGNAGMWLKGVPDAIAAVKAMREPAHVTVVSLDRASAAGLDVDRVVGGLDPAGMAALYAESDVLLKLSRTEGLGLPPLEAAAVGRPSVVTPYGGHADWLRHGVNGVQVAFDDPPGTAAWLDALARDRDLLRALGREAFETARDWATVPESAQAFSRALRAIAEDDRAIDHAAVRRASARALTRGMEVGRMTYAGVADALAHLEHERERHAAMIAEIDEHNRALIRQREAAEERIEELQATRAYRLATGLRSTAHTVRRPVAAGIGLARRLRGTRP